MAENFDVSLDILEYLDKAILKDIRVPSVLYEKASALLETSDDYRVIRRLRERQTLDAVPEGCKLGIFLDTEATGTNIAVDDVMELGMVPFAYNDAGEIVGILKTFDKFREPSIPIPPEVTELTGITNAMVMGTTIDPFEVYAFVEEAAIIIAHHAAFDRPMVEKIWPVFKEKNWACTFREVDWKANGFDGAKLGLLLMQIGYFHNGHRAIDDCHAGIELLGHTLENGRTGLSLLLEKAKQSQYILSLFRTPFEANTLLKDKGYRFNRDRKSWDRNIPFAEIDDTLEWAKTEVYRGTIPDYTLDKSTSLNRYSSRL